jgi:hypothetical protein
MQFKLGHPLVIRGSKPQQLSDGHPWHMLTADEISCMRGASSLGFHLNTLTGISGVRALRPDQDIPIPGRVHLPSRGEIRPDPLTGFEVLHLMGEACPTDTATTLCMLRPGDRARLLWWPDGGNNGPVRDADLHVDLLRLEVARADQVFIFGLASRICTASYRMIRTFDPATEPNLAGIRAA